MSGDEEGRTVFSPASAPGAQSDGQRVGEARSAAADAVAARPERIGAIAHVRIAGGRLQPGDMLNHIFEVRRFIAAGGMGEVWEGINTHTDERVAIKVMLPSLASDPNVQAMFRKEARTLTRLSHPALVQYRVLAMEPDLGVLYIVTDYVDGTNLGEVLRDVPRDTASLVGFLRRIAAGLGAAHALGAVHRDMAPDNVLLEDGRLDRARVIDFGIAKDLDPQKGTIVGDGFAGRLGYVAPEQLGDFGREVGPWSDVYSLALVTLAIAGGRAPAMGATLVEAVDRRRAGVDLSAAPEGLRPVLARMLEPDPQRRLRSMEGVIAALDAGPKANAPVASSAVRQPTSAQPGEARSTRSGRARLAVAGTAAVIELAVGGVWLRAPDDGPPPATLPVHPSAVTAEPRATDALAAARSAVTAALPGIACSWLDVRNLRRDGNGVSLSVSGVAGDPVAAQAALQAAIGRVTMIRDLQVSILPLSTSLCPAVDAYAQVRETGPAMLSIEKQDWEMDRTTDAHSEYAGQKVAKLPLFIDPRVSQDDFTVAGITKTGASPSGLNRRELIAGKLLEPTPDGRLTHANEVNEAGVVGYLLVRGQGPFDDAVVAPARFDAAWRSRFLATARERGWRAEMAWARTQDLTPN